MNIKEKINTSMKEKGFLSFAQLEKAAGLKDRTIYRWDVNVPSIDKVVKIASILDVSLDYLCGLTEENLPQSIEESESLKKIGKINDMLADLPDDTLDLFAAQLEAVVLRLKSQDK